MIPANKPVSLPQGFTLIEVLITVAILSVLTVLTAQSIQQALKSKAKIQEEIDDISRLRDALRLIERDIQLAFHYRDIEKELLTLVNKKPAASQPNPTNPAAGFGNQPAESPAPPEAEPTTNGSNREVPRMDPITHFIGLDESLHFVTSNNSRMVKNVRQADFIEVGYILKDCRSLKTQTSVKCLWRRSSAIVDDDVTKGGAELVLLENVSEFKLRYLGDGKQDWVTVWRTDAGGDAATKSRFPIAVEISIQVIGKKIKEKNKTYSSQIVVPIHFPNNASTDKTDNASATGKPVE